MATQHTFTFMETGAGCGRGRRSSATARRATRRARTRGHGAATAASWCAANAPCSSTRLPTCDISCCARTCARWTAAVHPCPLRPSGRPGRVGVPGAAGVEGGASHLRQRRRARRGEDGVPLHDVLPGPARAGAVRDAGVRRARPTPRCPSRMRLARTATSSRRRPRACSTRPTPASCPKPPQNACAAWT